MSTDKPRVSIGLVVYNGEKYLRVAIDSILGQTYSDFEFIISDNASNDGTQEICQSYRAMDNRIKYFRNATNLGADINFNRVFELSSGEYFKWAAHDDVLAPEFLERCVEILDQNASIVLCYPRTVMIGENGEVIGYSSSLLGTDSPTAYERFYNMLRVDHWCFQIFGVIRHGVLSKIKLHEPYYGSDRRMLTELCLWGKVYEFPEYLFYRRDHPLTTIRVSGGKAQNLDHFYPKERNKAWFLGLRRFLDYAGAVRRVSLNRSVRFLCYVQLVRLVVEKSFRRVKRWVFNSIPFIDANKPGPYKFY